MKMIPYTPSKKKGLMMVVMRLISVFVVSSLFVLSLSSMPFALASTASAVASSNNLTTSTITDHQHHHHDDDDVDDYDYEEHVGICTGSKSNAEQCAAAVLQQQQEQEEEESSTSSSSAESSSSTSSSLLDPVDDVADVICTDNVGKNCIKRSKKDGCIKDFVNMQNDCPATCFLCNSGNATLSKSRKIKGIKHISSNNENDKAVLQVQKIYNSQPQSIDASDVNMTNFIHRIDDYMYNQVYSQQKKFSLKERLNCKNRHSECTNWANLGECHINPTYMKIQCAPACFSCDEVDYQRRCNLNRFNIKEAWKNPGDLNRMFELIVSDSQYNVTILSQPRTNTSTTTVDGPWILVIDDFLTPEECETMIQLGHERGYTRSQDLSANVDFAGNLKSHVSQHRTSSTAWCDEATVGQNNSCANHEITRGIVEKMERLSGISQLNAEYLQLLQYREGQSYGYHHDYTSDHLLRPQGPRILTIFCYLNDVEAGGGTKFSLLGLTVTPKQGRVVIWPSVLNESPMHVDPRTAHEALPVEKGIKYGANAWIHQRDFKTPYLSGCS